MPYQALARKWRPRNFQQMVGQESVLQALINALSQERLHHAYLFTGTRGVGKTTIARIFAKCLNCTTGITANPCGECSICQQIDKGTFIDLIEIDAASRTKVEDTRELLESVQYATHKGRYKVYVIDEVHALSGHSFNALLKTLEEPPSHTKFLLATTEPQKIPVTVLSRCLQFSLKHLSHEQIAAHLAYILDEEKISYEQLALKKVAKAAQGSMRDALSLLDQVIAFCQHEITAIQVNSLLGSVQAIYFYQLLDAICTKNAQQVFDTIKLIAQHTTNFESLLEELLSVLHQVAVFQQIPGVSIDFSEPEKLQQWAGQLTPQEVQLFYQIALIGRRDLPLAPSPQAGFEMLLLRMLFFSPQKVALSMAEQIISPLATHQKPIHTSVNKAELQPGSSRANRKEKENSSPESAVEQLQKPITASDTAPKSSNTTPWSEVLGQLNLTGLTKTLASYCVIKKITQTHIDMALDISQGLLLNEKQRERLEQALNQFYGVSRRLEISVEAGESSPAILQKEQHVQQHQAAMEAIAQAPQVQKILQTFGAQLLPENVKLTQVNST